MDNKTETPILCACGCGQPVKMSKYPSKPQAKFINTHQHKGVNNGNYKSGKEKRACPICMKEFFSYPSQVAVTCGNDACYRKWQGLTTSARGINKTDIFCAYCRKLIKLFPSQIREQNYCSKPCMAKGIPKHGSSSGNWSGGKWVYYKKQTLMRDDYKCVICGFAFSVDVHHITPIASGGKDDFSNLITLCPNHHRMAHIGVIDLEPLRKNSTQTGLFNIVDPPFASH